MRAAVEIVCGPTGAGKTAALIELFRSADAGAALWIAPTDRSRMAMYPRLACEPDAPVHLATFPEVARRLVESADVNAGFAPELHQQFILDDVIAQLSASGELRHFREIVEGPGFSRAVFNLLTELKGRGISPAEFAEACRQAFGNRPKDADVERIYSAYQRRLTELRLFDRETAYARATQLVRQGSLGPWADLRLILLDGFVEFTRPQFDLLESLAEYVDRLVVSLVSDPNGDDRRAEAFERARDTEAELATRFAGRLAIHPLELNSAARPAGIAHLARSLFLPFREATRSDDAAGVTAIEGPAVLGEVRLLARAVKSLLNDGVPGGAIVVAARRLEPYAELVHEVFAEYAIPPDIEASRPLIRCPVVATLLRVLRLPQDDFPFAGTTALLRSTYLRPAWQEFESDTTIALQADSLLRGLGVPRGRSAFQTAVGNWAAAPEPGFEDEDAEAPHRHHLHRLAGRCRPFLERFFAAWDALPQSGELPAWTTGLHRLADDLGIAAMAGQSPADALALGRLFHELDDWSEREGRLQPRRTAYSLATFSDLAARIASAMAMPLTNVDAGAVRVVSAEQTRALECDYLFLIGLGEGSFPLPADAGPFYSQAERNLLQGVGLDLRVAARRIADEKLLFLQLASKPRRQLTLSYPATDDRGQELLPCSFLGELTVCFEPGRIATVQRTMLLSGWGTDPPLSAAEARVHWAMTPASARPAADGDLFDHLRRAETMAQQRFGASTVSPFDGGLGDPAIVTELSGRFSPDRVVSPTALERYIACPFKFLIGDVLGLSALEEPGEVVEATDRGAVVHRALARVHGRANVDRRPDAAFTAELTAAIDRAVAEEAKRAVGPAAQALWQLEGRRLRRLAGRYARQWAKFLETCAKDGIVPRPQYLEFEFGSSEETGAGRSVVPAPDSFRIRGRIDRIDRVELPDGSAGFIVLDYKTGSSGISASEIASMQRLQLPLYALAAEANQPDARPVGMAYWFLNQSQPLRKLPDKGFWVDGPDEWNRFRARLGEWVRSLARAIRSGDFALRPRSPHCTAYCEFSQVCRIGQSRHVVKEGGLALPEVPADE